MAQISQIHFFSGMPVRERLKSKLNIGVILKFFCYGSYLVLATPVKYFLFRDQIIKILGFLFGRDLRSHFNNNTFSKYFRYGIFCYMSTLRKNVFPASPVKLFICRAQITHILLFLGM